MRIHEQISSLELSRTNERAGRLEWPERLRSAIRSGYLLPSPRAAWGGIHTTPPGGTTRSIIVRGSGFMPVGGETKGVVPSVSSNFRLDCGGSCGRFFAERGTA